MRKKYVYSLVAVMSVACVVAVTGLVSKADESEVKEYRDKHGNRVIEYVNPVDPGNEPAAPIEEHPLSNGEVQGDLMTAQEGQVAEQENAEEIVVTPIEENQVPSDTVANTPAQQEVVDAVPDVPTNVITYTDKHGNKVIEYINPVDPGNEPATMPDTVPSTQGNVQGDIMTLDEPIIN